MAYTKAQLIDLLRGYARRYGIDEEIAIAQIDAESRFNPSARSGEANGIAQFTPATAQRFGVNVWDVNSSFDGWGRYMRWLLDRFNGSYPLALAGYNAGEGNVDKYGGIPPFKETRDYVEKILRNVGAHSPPPVIDVGPPSPFPYLDSDIVPYALPPVGNGATSITSVHVVVIALVAFFLIDTLLEL